MRKIVVVVSLLVIAAGGWSVWHYWSQPDKNNSEAGQVVDTLPHKSGSSTDLSRLASGVRAPSSSWISGLILQKNPEPVFASPLALQLTAQGLGFGVPHVTSTADAVNAPYNPDFQVDFPAKSFRLTYFDGVVARLLIPDVGELTIAQGSPYLWLKASSTQKLPLSGKFAGLHGSGQTLKGDGGVATIAGKGSFSSAGANLHKNDVLALGVLPQHGDTKAFIAAASHQITKATTTTHLKGEAAQTAISYATVDDKAPIVITPSYFAKHADTSKGTYPTLFGDAPLQQTDHLEYSVARVAPSDQLNLSHLSGEQRSQLRTQLAADTAATKITASDTYTTGKQLGRAANLLQIARQLNDQSDVKKLTALLDHAFSSQFSAKNFYYDAKLHGIVPNVKAFGVEDLNDHHFQYGYWLYAGAILGAHDPSFVHTYGPWLDALAADYASPQNTADFDQTRVYDAYAGHSWASGLAPFADGNNQESSSEAVHAWNGAALWAKTRGDSALESKASALLSFESYTAQHLWRTPPDDSKYTPPLTDIVWGGKLVYHTWFSDDPSAKLGIQIIPADPSQRAVMSRDADIVQRVTRSTEKGFNGPLGDWDVMYYGLAQPEAAAKIAKHLTTIDPGNSKTYLLAYIFASN